MAGHPEGLRPVTYCLPFYLQGQWDGILCSAAHGLGLGSLQSSAQQECRSGLLPPRSYGRLSVTGDQGLFQAWGMARGWLWHGMRAWAWTGKAVTRW